MSLGSLSVGKFHRPSSIHWYAMFSAMRKLAWAFVSNLRAVCSISTKQAFWCLKQPGKSYVPLVGVWLVRTAFLNFYHLPNLHLFSPFRHSGLYNIAHVQSQHMWQTSTCTPRHQLPSKLRLMRLELRKYFLRTFTCLLLSFYISDHFAFVICVVLICYWFYLFSQMLNERGCERDSNCSGMFRTSSKLQRAQCVHVAFRMGIHANEPSTAWADTPTAMIIIILNNNTVLYV